MAYGLQVFSATGATVLDSTHRCGRVMGMFATGSSSGSISVSVPATTQLWASLVSPNVGDSFSFGSPAVSVSGSTITWTFVGSPGVSSLIVYGCF